MTVLLPRRIGAIRVLERLGEGGMAFVHRAEDPFRPDWPLAVKFLRVEAAADSELVVRFLREGEVLRHLHHPNLVEVIDFGRAGSTPYILMELLPGGTIKQCFGEAPARFLRRLQPVAGALQVAHEAGVIHRDLKPSNLLFAPDGRLKVTDFGVCLWEGGEGTRVTRSQMVVGTLGYMAPEQHGDPRNVDGRCDVYALGSILYEFTTGRPYSQVQMPPAAIRTGFPPRLARILMQSLAPDPAKRIPTMAALAEEWALWLESAESAGWGEEPLPGFSRMEAEQATVTRVAAKAPQGPDPEARLGPYLDGLRTGGVGARRAAAEGLQHSVLPGDEGFLLEALAAAPDGMRFALVTALGAVGTPAALPALLGLLADPFAQRESAEAASLIAQRAGAPGLALPALHEAGLGSNWRWAPRARLGDESWVAALAREWANLSAPLRIQGLEAARELPAPAKARFKERLRPVLARASGQLQRLWESL
ncbi:MAG: protein kinase [Holophaga sp.]|nr:protein kinase [Holophaga sp.]